MKTLYFVPFCCARGYNDIKNMSKRTIIINNVRVMDLQHYILKAICGVVCQWKQ
ncbi:MAG: hypothetical protein ACJARX_000363 [Psychroserpens sp.]|jgi:hypothetical protein